MSCTRLKSFINDVKFSPFFSPTIFSSSSDIDKDSDRFKLVNTSFMFPSIKLTAIVAVVIEFSELSIWESNEEFFSLRYFIFSLNLSAPVFKSLIPNCIKEILSSTLFLSSLARSLVTISEILLLIALKT